MRDLKEPNINYWVEDGTIVVMIAWTCWTCCLIVRIQTRVDVGGVNLSVDEYGLHFLGKGISI